MRRSASSKAPPPDLVSEPHKYAQEFYRRERRKFIYGILLSIVTLGIWPLICLCKRSLWIHFAYTRCEPADCSVVSFTYFSPDGLQLAPHDRMQGGLLASDYVCPRIDVGGGWWLYYDDASRGFIRYDGPSSGSRGPSSLNASHRAFSKINSDIDNREISTQLESGINWLNKGKDDESELVGYQKVPLFTFLLYFEFFISAGIFWLFCYWQPYLQLYLTHRRCNLLAADTILIMTPPNKSKQQKNAADMFSPWLQRLFYYGLVHIALIFLPVGFFVMLAFLIVLHIILRPYTVRPVHHSTRDGQLVKVSVTKARLVGYFKGTSCSESSVIKFFTWQKVKYVWSGATVYGPPSSQSVIEAYRFERQSGLIAPDEVDPRSPEVHALWKHQVMGAPPTLSYLHGCQGLSQNQVALTSGLLGKNAMNLPLTPLFVVFLREILSPFYIFQIFSVSVWLADGYIVYAYVIIILSAISMIWQIVAIRMREVALRKTMHKSNKVEVCRSGAHGETVFVEPDQLVPGDVIMVPKSVPAGGYVLQCDAALLSGTCLVDEAMLTGESVPVLKFGLPPVKSDGSDDELLQIRKNERSLLFCGTRVLQANTHGSPDGKIRAVVIRTGFMTAKGELTRLILYPKPLDFEFAVDAVKFIGVMGAIAFVGLCYSIGLRVSRNEDPKIIVLRSLDIITIAVPPALPIALTIGYMMAQRRLQKKSVFCTSPSAINVAGIVDVVCMDKTGTMTEGGLDFEKLLPVKEGRFVSQTTPASLSDNHLLRCLVSCHSLAVVDGKAIGDPIEEKMFEMAGWSLDQGDAGKSFSVPPNGHSATPIMVVRPPPNHTHGAPAIGIIRQLPFSSHFQRMSVVACPTEPGSRSTGMSLYLKGAPEIVVSICRVTTVPADLDIHLSALTESGYRVLGLATKSLTRYSVADILSADRGDLESDLDFLGLLVFENKLKPETCGTIDKLKKAKLRILMLTGDNALTAVSVARQAGIIEEKDQVLIVNAFAPSPQTNGQPVLDFIEVKRKTTTNNSPSAQQAGPRLAATTPLNKKGERPPSYILDMLPVSPTRAVKLVVTGSSWAIVKEHFPEEADRILMRGAVFARVNPNQKKEVIEGLQHLGLYCLMCGDGANDCGALRAAGTGVSLSQAEASVASPFTSKIENISCIHLLVREGRCALVTSFSIFRFMLLYAFIQFITTFILYYSRANLGQFGFLYADLFLATTLVFTMSFTEAYDYLVAEKPPSSLLEIQPLLSIFLQGFLIIIFQILSYLYVVYGQHAWFLPFNPPVNDTENYFCFEYYATFLVSIFQYPCMAIVLSKGVPFRKPIFTNWLFCINLAINFASNLFLCFDPLPPFPPYPRNLVNSEYKSFGDLLQLAMPPSVEYRGIVFLFSSIFCFASLLTEIIFVERPWLSNAIRRAIASISNKPATRRKYEILEEQLGSGGADPWPHITRSAQGGAGTLLAQEQRVAGNKEHDEKVKKPIPRLPPSYEKPEDGGRHQDLSEASGSNFKATIATALQEAAI